MPPLILTYIVFRSTLCLVAVFFGIQQRKKLLFLEKRYLKFLSRPWKIITFVIATIGLSGIGALGYDPSWDIPITVLMWVGTYYFAPYTVGIWYRYFAFQEKDKVLFFIATILMMFTTCWLYEGYATAVLLGFYPPMALANMGLSPLFYSLAGLMWSLDVRHDGKIVFAFMEKEWVEFQGDRNQLSKIFIFSLPIILFMVFIMWAYLYFSMYPS